MAEVPGVTAKTNTAIGSPAMHEPGANSGRPALAVSTVRTGVLSFLCSTLRRCIALSLHRKTTAITTTGTAPVADETARKAELATGTHRSPSVLEPAPLADICALTRRACSMPVLRSVSLSMVASAGAT